MCSTGPVDRVILLDGGRIVADTTPAKILSSPLLQEHGIREPLYVTALKYAGCEIAEEDHPESVEEIRLEGREEALRGWFASETPHRRSPRPGSSCGWRTCPSPTTITRFSAMWT